MVPPAAAMTVMALLLMDWSLDRGSDLAGAQNLVLLLVVLFQNVYVPCMRSERRPLWREPLGSNPWLLLGVGGAMALHIVALTWTPLAALLGTGPVGSAEVALCLAAAALIVLTTEVTKLAVRKWRGGRR